MRRMWTPRHTSSGRIPLAGVVVRAAAAHDRDVVTALHQLRGEIAGVLRRRRDVGVEGLIEKQNSHGRSGIDFDRLTR